MTGLSRMECWSRLGRIQTSEVVFSRSAAIALEKEWRGRLTDNDYRGNRWWTSLRGSQFPGDDPRYCARRALYGLMGMPNEKPSSAMLAGTAVVGSAVEEWHVLNLERDGRLLAASESRDPSKRVGFVDADHWLTGSPDFIILPPFWNRPHLVETKTKDADVVVEMRNGRKAYDPQHASQTRDYIGLGNRITPLIWPSVVVCGHTWRLALRADGVQWGDDDPTGFCCPDHTEPLEPGTCLMRLELEPLRTGSLRYMGRDRPGNVVVEYFFEHDERWFQTGLSKLAEVRRLFESDELPPHPFGGKEWSKQPCAWCDFKKHCCKPDHNDGVTKLSESNGIKFATDVYGQYDPEWAREQVLDRWRGRTGVSYALPQNIEKGES